MAAEKGSAFLLKIGDGALSPTYTTVAGLRTTAISLSADTVNITSKASAGWRELLSGAGIRAASITASGVFTNSAAEARLRANALAGDIDDYRIQFESGGTISGRFQVTKLDYAGDYNGERTYSLTLESSGALTVVA